MKNQLKIQGYSLIIDILLLMLCGMQTTQNHKNAILVFAFLLLYIAVFCVTENKKLPLKSIEFFQSLAFGSGIFCLTQFWNISHQHKYEYFFLILGFIAILKINDQFDNEKLKNNIK
jgi:hypothetical protein